MNNLDKVDRSASIESAVTGRTVIFGDSIVGGIDIDDAKETGEIKNAIVVQFDSEDDMKQALRNGIVRLTF